MFHKPDARIDRLANVNLFGGCTPAELRELARITSPLDVSAGTVLCREGDVGRECFIVLGGDALVTIGGEHICMIGPGGFFGEMALLDGGPRVATVTAASDMQLLVLSRGEFATLLMDLPSVSRKMLAALGERLRVADSQLHPARTSV